MFVYFSIDNQPGIERKFVDPCQLQKGNLAKILPISATMYENIYCKPAVVSGILYCDGMLKIQP